MQKYWVEGVFLPKQAYKRADKTGQTPTSRTKAEMEPFSMAIWANSPEEALRMAKEKVKTGEWVEGPAVVKKSEEERMRTMGAPELPGFSPVKSKR